MPRNAHIVMVDDNPEELGVHREAFADSGIKLDILAPTEVEEKHVTEANLILVDYDIDRIKEVDSWEGLPLAFRPADGVALAMIFRRHAAALTTERPTAVAVLTGQVEQIAKSISVPSRIHLISRLFNLEWIFRKNDPDLHDRIMSLGQAVGQLTTQWSQPRLNPSVRELMPLLGIDAEHDLIELYVSDVESCRPPIHDASLASSGLAIVRWMSQRVLPYPTFLRSLRYVAARLRVTYSSLKDVVDDGKSKLGQQLEDYRYTGMLETFDGPRWWRSGIEAMVWDMTDGAPGDRGRLLAALHTLSDGKIEPVAIQEPVVAVDVNLRAQDEDFRPDQLVRLQPDSWPAYADQAWCLKQDAAEDPTIRAQVLLDDLELLGTEGEDGE